MPPAQRPERRNARRFPLALPVTLSAGRADAGEAAAETRDVSARGVFFHLDQNLEEGAKFEFTLTLPEEITLTESIRVRCRARVVRVQRAGGGKRIGVAAVIEQYDFVGEG